MNNIKGFLLFGVAGVIGYIADVVVTLGLEKYIGLYASRIPAFLAAATVTWLFNRSVTFRTNKSKYSNLFKEYIHYLSLMIVGLIVNYLVYAISVTVLKNVNYYVLISIALGSLSGMVINYFNSKKYIFNKKSTESID